MLGPLKAVHKVDHIRFNFIGIIESIVLFGVKK